MEGSLGITYFFYFRSFFFLPKWFTFRKFDSFWIFWKFTCPGNFRAICFRASLRTQTYFRLSLIPPKIFYFRASWIATENLYFRRKSGENFSSDGTAAQVFKINKIRRERCVYHLTAFEVLSVKRAVSCHCPTYRKYNSVGKETKWKCHMRYFSTFLLKMRTRNTSELRFLFMLNIFGVSAGRSTWFLTVTTGFPYICSLGILWKAFVQLVQAVYHVRKKELIWLVNSSLSLGNRSKSDVLKIEIENKF